MSPFGWRRSTMGRWLAAVVGVAVALAGVAGVGTAGLTGGPAAAAAPTGDPAVGVHSQARALDAVIEQYHTAQVNLAASRRQVRQLDASLAALGVTVDARQREVGRLAAAAYVVGITPSIPLMLGSGSPGVLSSLALVDELAHIRSQRVAGFLAMRRDLEARRTRAAQLAAADAERTGVLAAQAHYIEDQIAALAKASAALPPDLSGRYVMPVPRLAGAVGVVVRWAFQQLGKPYSFGAAGPGSFDCSGLTLAAWGQVGVHLTHAAAVQMRRDTTPVSRADLRPGDLVFYNHASHVALYIGGGMVIHAPEPGEDVRLVPVDRAGTYYGAGRPR